MNYWFLYDLTTGAITYAYRGNAGQWTNIPSGQGVLGPFSQDTANTTVQDAFDHPTYYTVQNDALVAVANIADLQLADVKVEKLSELQSKRDAVIDSTFQSSALGSVKTYNYDETAQSNFRGKALMLSLNPGITSVNWYTIEDATFVPHTRDQFIQVCNDGSSHQENAEMNYYNLEAQVKAATTIDQVNAITW